MLKNHADALASLSQLAFAHGSNILTVHCYHAAGRPLQKVDAPYQGGFAGTAKAYNAVDFTLIDMKADILDGLDGT